MNAPALFQELMNKILSILRRRPVVQELIGRGAQMEAHVDDVCKTEKRKLGGEEQGHNHQQHTRTAHSAHNGEQAPRGPGHRTPTCTEVSKGTGHHGLHPQGRTHWGDPAGPPGQWQERYSEATGPNPAVLHRGPWQTSPGGMEATDDRRAGTQPRRGSPAKQRGPATRATGVRRSYRRLAGAIPLW